MGYSGSYTRVNRGTTSRSRSACNSYSLDHVTPRHLSDLRHTLIVKVIPPHHALERLLTQVGVDKVLPLRRPDPPVDFPGRLSAEETGHFPVDKPHDLVIVDNAVGRPKSLCTKLRTGSVLASEKIMSPSTGLIQPLVRMLGS